MTFDGARESKRILGICIGSRYNSNRMDGRLRYTKFKLRVGELQVSLPVGSRPEVNKVYFTQNRSSCIHPPNQTHRYHIHPLPRDPMASHSAEGREVSTRLAASQLA